MSLRPQRSLVGPAPPPVPPAYPQATPQLIYALKHRSATRFYGSSLPSGVATTVQRVAAGGFEVIPRRWAVERTFSWLGRSWRLSRGYERKVKISEAFTQVAMIPMIR